MNKAIVLAGHGSHIVPETAGIVWGFVDTLRSWVVADEVTAAFWKEMPAFSQVLNGLTSDNIVVVPMFTSTGYFTQKVLPSEMGLAGEITHRGEQTIYTTPALGTHPAIFEILRDSIVRYLSQNALNGSEVSLALIAHGTPRHAHSGDLAILYAEKLADLVAYSTSVYLDDEPFIPTIYDTAPTDVILALPFFLAYGSHVTIDLPEALEIDPSRPINRVRGKDVHYLPPVGIDPAIPDLILSLARDSGLSFEKQNNSQLWSGFPSSGSQKFLAWVKEEGEIQFGELLIRPDEIRPIDANNIKHQMSSPHELRQHIRQDPFRPLSTSRDIPSDWYVPITSDEQLIGIVETIYPNAIATWAQDERKVASLDTVASRQRGMFTSLHEILTPSMRDQFVERICRQCVCHPI